MDFSDALRLAKAGRPVYRLAWRGSTIYYAPKVIVLNPGEPQGFSYIELIYTDGRVPGRAPWQPNRCDMLEDDWVTYSRKMPRWWNW
jgi:hypothetical protein